MRKRYWIGVLLIVLALVALAVALRRKHDKVMWDQPLTPAPDYFNIIVTDNRGQAHEAQVSFAAACRSSATCEWTVPVTGTQSVSIQSCVGPPSTAKCSAWTEVKK